MNRNEKDKKRVGRNLSPAFMVAAAIINLLLLLFPYWPPELWIFPFPYSRTGVLIPSLAIIGVGAIIFLCAAVTLKSGYFGNVQPTTDLVTSGVYRYIRHPMYLSYLVAMLGVDLASRNIFSFPVTFLCFLPTLIYRARQEEKALANKFGQRWISYSSTTGFLLPRIRKTTKTGRATR
nr:isoprenylcysteine carboxylmethyltransferase family protein [Candidatus Njordarchaeota archaeon]